MGRLNDVLDLCGEFFLATADGNQPKVRPVGAHMEKDGKVIFSVGDHKEVYRQLKENPRCEIAGMVKKGQWLRLTGKAVFEGTPGYAEEYLEAHPGLKKIYNEDTGHRLAMFHLEEAEAHIYAMGRIVEEIPV